MVDVGVKALKLASGSHVDGGGETTEPRLPRTKTQFFVLLFEDSFFIFLFLREFQSFSFSAFPFASSRD